MIGIFADYVLKMPERQHRSFAKSLWKLVITRNFYKRSSVIKNIITFV